MFILAIQIIIHMKNNFLLPLIITLVVSSSTVKSQNSWSQTYPIASSLGEELNDLAHLPGNGFIGVGSIATDTIGNHDILLMRCDQNGNLVWSKQFNGGSNEVGESIDLFPTGGFVIGSTKSNTTQSSAEVLITRTDSIGNILWTQNFTANGYDVVKQVDVLSDGKIIVAGSTIFCQNAFTCGFGMLLDSNGVIIWSRSFEKESNNEFLDVINTSDGGFLFSGSTFDIFSGQNGWAVKTDSMGVLTWSNSFDAPSLDIFYKATENLNLQNYAFAGETTVDAFSNSDALLVVCDYTGAYVIGGSAGGVENDRATGIHAGAFGNFIMTGQTDIDTLFQTYAQGLSLEVDIATGNINNAVTIGDRVSNTFIKSSAVDNQGMILLGGFGDQFSGNKNQTFAIQKNSVPNTVCFEDGFTQLTTLLAHTDNFLADTTSIVYSFMSLGLNIIPVAQVDSFVCGTTSLNENTNQSNITLFPNPSNGKFQLSGFNGKSVLINVFDNMGRIVYSKNNITSDTIIDITNQSTGIYLIQITGTNFNQAIRYTLIND
jgi:hypothetical protein